MSTYFLLLGLIATNFLKSCLLGTRADDFSVAAKRTAAARQWKIEILSHATKRRNKTEKISEQICLSEHVLHHLLNK